MTLWERESNEQICTMTMPSLAESATISAHETVKGHSFSSASLIVLTYLKFLIPKLLSDACSDSIPFTVSNNRDASHDYTNQQAITLLTT